MARSLLAGYGVKALYLFLAILAVPCGAMELRLLDVAGLERATPLPPRLDPLANFDALWNAFDRDYAFFRERGVDWAAARGRHRARLSTYTTPVELYRECRAMLDALNDDHVSLEAPKEIQDAAFPPGPPGLDLAALAAAVAARHAPGARSAHGGMIRWAAIDERTAYLQVNAMEGYAKSAEADARAVRAVMDVAVRALGTREVLILDLRFNGGGYDDVSLEILSRIARKRERVLSRKLRRGDGFGPREHVSVTPATQRFGGRVVILTSHETASAAESLVLASRAMPHVTRIGSNTNGILSDKEEGTLPNGWTYSLSNMVVEGHDGQVFEVTGIPPDRDLGYAKDPATFSRQVLEALIP